MVLEGKLNIVLHGFKFDSCIALGMHTSVKEFSDCCVLKINEMVF